MVEKNGDDMARMVIAAFPQAAATLQIAEGLADYLPIESPDHVIKLLEERPIEAMGAKITGKMLEGLLPEDAFPIKSADALASSVAAAVRTGAHVLGQRDVGIKHDDMRAVAAKLNPAAQAEGPVAMGWLGNDSLFGFKKATHEKET